MEGATDGGWQRSAVSTADASAGYGSRRPLQCVAGGHVRQSVAGLQHVVWLAGVAGVAMRLLEQPTRRCPSGDASAGWLAMMTVGQARVRHLSQCLC
jgi:hypothetical protein